MGCCQRCAVILLRCGIGSECYRAPSDLHLAIVDRYRNLRVVLSSANIEASLCQPHRVLAAIRSLRFRFHIILQAYRDACWKLARRIAAHCLLSAVIRLRVSIASDRDVGFVRCRDLKLAICQLDVVIIAVGAFRQCVVEGVVNSSLIRDRLEVAVRRAVVSDKAFLLSGCRCCAFFTVRIAIIRPAVAARCDSYRTLADCQLAILSTYSELLGDILSVSI